jgi:hypothetical protein
MTLDDREPEELAANRHVVLVADEDGYSLWQVDRYVEAPLATFPASVEGSDDAWEAFERATRLARVGRLLNGLVWSAGILGIVWVAATTTNYVILALLSTGHLSTSSDWIYWLGVLTQVAWAAFLTASVIYVLVWLQRHPQAGRRRFRPIEP